MDNLELTCEIKEIKAKKQMLDVIYRIVLETNDSNALALGMLKADQLISVKIEETNG